MSKSEKELNELRAQMEELKKKFEELTPDEVEKVTGGLKKERLLTQEGPLYKRMAPVDQSAMADELKSEARGFGVQTGGIYNPQ